MALVTQCPHCQTTFRVAHDQLKLRAGLVRCGACKQIFNGVEHLVRPDDAVPAAAPVTPVISSSPVVPITPPATAVVTPPENSEQQNLPATNDKPGTIEADASTRSAADSTPAIQEEPVAPSASSLDFVPISEPDRPQQLSTPGALRAGVTAADAPGESTSGTAHNDPSMEEDPLQRMTLADFTTIGRDDLDLPANQLQEAASPVHEENKTGTSTRPPLEQTGLSGQSYAHPSREPTASVNENVEGSDTDETVLENAVLDQGTAANEAVVDHAAADHTVADHVTSDHAAASPLIRHPAGPLAAADSADLEEPSFVTKSRRRQKTRRVMRTLLSIGSIILMLGITVQAAYAFRDQLAAWFPQTKPALAQLCQIVGCQIKLPAQIDMVSIESHELQGLSSDKNIFALTLLLRNRSTVTQAWPTVELTLNDSNEKPLARRVLTPNEYLPSKQDVTKGFPAQSEQAVKVVFELSQLSASGYRVYLFYP